MASRSAPQGDDISSRTIVLIPARLGSTRLPDKPLAPIAGAPMIVHVWRRAHEAGVGPVVVACAEPAIADAVRAAGGEAVLTDPALPSGTDRIFAALQQRRSGAALRARGQPAGRSADARPGRRARTCWSRWTELGTDMATLANATEDEHERQRPQRGQGGGQPSTRAAPRWAGRSTSPARPHPAAPARSGTISASTPSRATALERFAALPPSPLEQRERLEQLRALENGMSIGVRLVDAVPFGVDTPADLEKARRILEASA